LLFFMWLHAVVSHHHKRKYPIVRFYP
jgi:hypothetical protein